MFRAAPRSPSVIGGSDDAKGPEQCIRLMVQQRRVISCCEGSFHAMYGPPFHSAHRRSDREGQLCQVGTLTPGPVAQRIEQQPSKLKVAGSIPAGVASKINDLP
jgi:hypothetical protein